MQQSSKAVLSLLAVVIATALSLPSATSQSAPVSGYYDIPSGFDFPADKQKLEQFRASENVSAQRLHVWNVFAGMTHLTPDNKYPIFETWYSEDETFQVGPTPQGLAPRRVVRRFRQPKQFRTPVGFEPQAAGTALLSFVLYNHSAYDHIRKNLLYRVPQLENLLQSGAADAKIPNNRTVPAFPVDAVSLKTVWWPVAKDKVTPMPVWDPELNPAKPTGNDYTTWGRVILIDPTKPNIPPDATSDTTFLGKAFPNSHVVGLKEFYYVTLDQQTVTNAMQDPGIARAAQIALGRALQPGDYTVFAGTHITTKEIDDWVWATFWWHDRPKDGRFAADRPDSVKGVWRNYLMSASYDLNLPHESDGGPHVAFNPWLEARFRDGGDGGGVASNCMNCHNRASYPRISFLPIHRGNPELQQDPAFGQNRLRTDFLWSVPESAQ